MTRRPASCALVLSVLLSLGFLPMTSRPVEAASPDPDTHARLLQAIDSIRGIDLTGLDDAAKGALGEKLDAAWQVFMDEPGPARSAIREALAAEKDDSFLIIDLCSALMALEGEKTDLEEIAGHLVKADPNVYTRSFFRITAYMASRHCRACLPAVLKVLDVRRMDAYIDAHSLPVGDILGRVFTVDQYGDEVIDSVVSRLGSDDCIVRRNAAAALGDLVPAGRPAPLMRMAVSDACVEARTSAWYSLAMLGAAGPTTVTARMSAGPAPEGDELDGIVFALASTPGDAADTMMQELITKASPKVAETAREARSHLPAWKSREPGSKGGRARKKMIARLETAARTGHLDDEITAEEVYTALLPGDLPVVNRARAAVLNRVSDECLYEWYPLTHAAAALRAARD